MKLIGNPAVHKSVLIGPDDVLNEFALKPII